MEGERGPGLGFSLCFVCGSRPWGAAAFHLCLFIWLNVFECSPVPASFFPYISSVTLAKTQAWSSLPFHCCHSSFYSFRSSSVGLETGEWRRCRSLSFTPPASLRSHGSRPRPTRHIYIYIYFFFIYIYIYIFFQTPVSSHIQIGFHSTNTNLWRLSSTNLNPLFVNWLQINILHNLLSVISLC